MLASEAKDASTCKDYVIGSRFVNNVILEICDCCDYFATPLFMEKNNHI